MMKLEQIDRRHVVGLSALALTLLALGFAATREFDARHVAALPDMTNAQIARQDVGDTFEKVLAGLRRLPANAFGSAEALRPKEEARLDSKPGAATQADASQTAPVSPSSEAKFWSDQEWRVASKAVEDFRGARKPQKKDLGSLTWRPPEEIANKGQQAH